MTDPETSPPATPPPPPSPDEVTPQADEVPMPPVQGNPKLTAFLARMDAELGEVG